MILVADAQSFKGYPGVPGAPVLKVEIEPICRTGYEGIQCPTGSFGIQGKSGRQGPPGGENVYVALNSIKPTFGDKGDQVSQELKGTERKH